MNIAITGATGYIGRKLVDFLAQAGYRLSLIVRTDSDLSGLDKNIQLFTYDGTFKSLIKSCAENDLVIHLAAYSKKNIDTEGMDLDKYIDSNIRFGLHLLEAMNQTKCKKLINTGTYSIYDENGNLCPDSIYSVSKQVFEEFIKYYVRAKKLSAVSLRLYDVYGEDDERPKIINLLKNIDKKGPPLAMSAGEQYINLLHINDVLSAYQAAIKIISSKRINYEEYGVYSKDTLRLKDLVELISKLTEEKLNVDLGARAYPPGQIMKPYFCTKLPNWEARVSLQESLKKLFVYE